MLVKKNAIGLMLICATLSSALSYAKGSQAPGKPTQPAKPAPAPAPDPAPVDVQGMPGYITGLYQHLLSSSPSADDLSFYENAAAKGTSCSQMAVFFMESSSFTPINPKLSTPQFITDLYEALLDRKPSADDLTYYQYIDRTQIAEYILKSPEFNTDCSTKYGFSSGAGSYVFSQPLYSPNPFNVNISPVTVEFNGAGLAKGVNTFGTEADIPYSITGDIRWVAEESFWTKTPHGNYQVMIGTIVYAGDKDFVGTDTFTVPITAYLASDGKTEATSTVSVSITITPAKK